MKCVICRQGETTSGTATVTLERDEATLVFKSVPAQVCENCGEEYVDSETASQLLAVLTEAVAAGVVLDVRQYAVV